MKQNGIGPLMYYFNRLNKDEVYHQIAGILLKNAARLGDMSIQKASEICYTSTATISRLVRRAGYPHFNALKEAVQQQCTNYYRENRILEPYRLEGNDTPEVYLEEVISMLGELKDNLDRDAIRDAAELIHEADTVHYFGSFDSVRRFQQDLFICGKTLEVYPLFGAPNPDPIKWPEKSVAIVENPGYPWLECNDLIPQIKACGAKVILITCSSSREIADTADLCIRLAGTRSGRDEVLYQSVISILSIEYRKRYMDDF